MVFIEPKRRRVEPLLVGFASATYTTEVTDEFECGERVVGPGFLDSLDGFVGWCGGDNMEKEI